MKRSDKRRIARGMILCACGKWRKFMHHGKLTKCSKCKERDGELII